MRASQPSTLGDRVVELRSAAGYMLEGAARLLVAPAQLHFSWIGGAQWDLQRRSPAPLRVTQVQRFPHAQRVVFALGDVPMWFVIVRGDGGEAVSALRLEPGAALLIERGTWHAGPFPLAEGPVVELLERVDAFDEVDLASFAACAGFEALRIQPPAAEPAASGIEWKSKAPAADATPPRSTPPPIAAARTPVPPPARETLAAPPPPERGRTAAEISSLLEWDSILDGRVAVAVLEVFSIGREAPDRRESDALARAGEGMRLVWGDVGAPDEVPGLSDTRVLFDALRVGAHRLPWLGERLFVDLLAGNTPRPRSRLEERELLFALRLRAPASVVDPFALAGPVRFTLAPPAPPAPPSLVHLDPSPLSEPAPGDGVWLVDSLGAVASPFGVARRARVDAPGSQALIVLWLPADLSEARPHALLDAVTDLLRQRDGIQVGARLLLP